MFEKTIEKVVTRTIQAMAEGRRDEIIIESYLTGMPISAAGDTREYRNYGAQVQALYRKYNGRDELGNWQARACVDTRTAFIAGEGISVATTDMDLAKWIDDFLRYNRLKGSRFHQFVKAGEMEGNALLYLEADRAAGKIKVLRHRTSPAGGTDFRVQFKNRDDVESVEKVFIKRPGAVGDEEEFKGEFKYIVLGGDGSDLINTTTRVGSVLQEIDNYDRALNCMRKNNHLFARPTPFFKTEKQADAISLLDKIRALGWKIGMALAGAADFSLVVPSVGAMENIKTELAALAKAIAATTGIPVHWLGHVDLMSNRSTAESLYETVNNATIQERAIWSEAIEDLIIAAQGVAIDKGILKGTVRTDFEVRIPLINFSRALDVVRALNIAFTDGAISIQDYRNALPGIDPYNTARALEEAAEAEIMRFGESITTLEDQNGPAQENNNIGGNAGGGAT